MADHQRDWQALLLAAEERFDRYAAIMGGIEAATRETQGMLGDSGLATDQLTDMGLLVVRAAPGAKMTKDVLGLLRQAKQEQLRAMARYEGALKAGQTAQTIVMASVERIRRGIGEIGAL